MHDAQGGPVPKYGPKLRKIASDGVLYVYNNGAGSRRDEFESEREEKAKRFRKKYGSEGIGVDGEPQGNVQPDFVGVFDTVAALRSRAATRLGLFGVFIFAVLTCVAYAYSSWWLAAILAAVSVIIGYWCVVILKRQINEDYPFVSEPLHPS